MSLQLPTLNISQKQTFSDQVELRFHNDKLYICKVESDGSIINGAELVIDALPPSVLMGLNGSGASEVIRSVLSLSGIAFEDFDSDAREQFKEAILSGSTL